MKRIYVKPEIYISEFNFCDNTNYITISSNYGQTIGSKYTRLRTLNS